MEATSFAKLFWRRIKLMKFLSVLLLMMCTVLTAYASDYTVKFPGKLETVKNSRGEFIQRIYLPKDSAPRIISLIPNNYKPANPALDCESGVYEVDVSRDDEAGALPMYFLRGVIRCDN
jgi:hypothetical protein